VDDFQAQLSPAPQADGVAQNPVQHDAQTAPDPSHLDQQGEQMAPAPTSDGQSPDDASAEATPQFSFEDYQQLKQEHEAAQAKIREDEEVLGQLKRLAAEQQAAQATQKLRSELQQEVMDQMRKAGVEDEDAAAAIAERMFGRIDTTRATFQEQMETYQRQTDEYLTQALWAGTRNGYADHIIQQFDLDPAHRPRLLQANSEAEMLRDAQTLREAKEFYKSRAMQQAVSEQEQQRRASGVDTITGTNSGPISGDLKPGRNLDVLGALLSGTS